MVDRQQGWAIVMSVALHLGAASLLLSASHKAAREQPPRPKETALVMVVVPPAEQPPPSPTTPTQTSAPAAPAQSPATKEAAQRPLPANPKPPAEAARAYMNAPPAPSAEEWALAGTYALKNSKRYRYTWGQQVRSMMGTAHEGPEQGAVRFQIEIAPNGTLTQITTIWTTSPRVEARARQAVNTMPPLPPTPNGKPLIFEKTIIFDAWTSEAPPLYKDDCLPDPPQHRNRFVWDGLSPQVAAPEAQATPLDPQAFADCQKQLPQDSIEAEAASDDRQQKQWGSPTLGR